MQSADGGLVAVYPLGPPLPPCTSNNMHTLRLLTQMSQKLSLNADSMCRRISGRPVKRGATAVAPPAAALVKIGCV